MCGICGFVRYESDRIPSKEILDKMTAVLEHRGPDDQGSYYSNEIGLGHRRLAIIDLSKSANQPISNETEDIYLVCNGEIYNFIELRKELSANHRFKSRSDSEVLIHAYEKWGVNFLKRIRGMFAIALWDKKKKRLLLARDRAGEKPLVYMFHKGVFYFSSEIKSFLQMPDYTPELDPIGIHHYFLYFCAPPPYTVYKGIKKLEPGTYLLIEKGRMEKGNYWEVDFSKKWHASTSEYIDAYKDLLEQTTKSMMISDVPLGLMLSGGIDSSSILSVMAKHSDRPVKTFCVGACSDGYMDPEFERSKRVAGLFNAEHYEKKFTPRHASILPEMITYYDEPFNVYMALYSHELARLIKQNVTVVLSGNGADELFYGYNEHLFYKRLDVLEKWKLHIPDNELRNIFCNKGYTGYEKMNNILKLPLQKRRVTAMEILAQEKAKTVYSSKFLKEIIDVRASEVMENAFVASGAENTLEGMAYADLMIYHYYSTVWVMDTAGMAHALEVRSPFLDHKMIEFAASLPSNLKLAGLYKKPQKKWIMKKSMEGILPNNIIYAKKYSYGEHINWFDWMAGDGYSQVRSHLMDGILEDTGLFDMKKIGIALDRFVKTREKFLAYLLWGVLVFKVWYEIYFLQKNFQTIRLS